MEDQQQDVPAVVIKPLSLENETNFSVLQEHGREEVNPPKTNFSAFPHDFVTQFSPVEEEPVPRKLSSAEEFVDIDDKTYSSSPSTTEHHNVHFDTAALQVDDSEMRKEGGGGAHDEEEFTYHRSGPLLVGEPVAVPRVTLNGPKTTPAVEEEKEAREEEPQARIVQPPSASFVCSLKKDAEVEESSQTFFTWLVNEPRLKDLVYWRDWQKSLAVFGPGFVLLLCLTLFPFLSVLAYTGLLVIAVNFTLRLYVAVSGYLSKNKAAVEADAETSAKCQCRYEKAVQNYLSGADLQLNDAKVREQVETNVARWNTWFPWLQRLLLAEDVFATLKLALALWLLTYVGAWLSPAAMTLISFVATFTLPKFYHTYKKPIDKRLADVSKKAQGVSSAVKDKYSSLTTQKRQLKKTE